MLKDHLGNTRVLLEEDGTVLENSDYYPFGLQVARGQTVTSPENRYKYNGKELQTELGLGQYDYGARFYDPVIARWNVIDPLAEKYYSSTPYNYVDNNPIIKLDPNGMSPYTHMDKHGNVLELYDEGYLDVPATTEKEIEELLNRLQIDYPMIDSDQEEPNKKRKQNKTNLNNETNKVAVIYDGKGYFGTNFIGPGPEMDPGETGLEPKDMIDQAAFYHDRAYYNAGVTGVSGALFSSEVRKADKILYNEALKVSKMYLRGGYIDPVTKQPINTNVNLKCGVMFKRCNVITLLLFFLTSCHNNNNNRKGMIERDEGLFDIIISGDGTKIIYSWVNGGVASIYQANLDGSEPEVLIKSKSELSYVSPSISQSGKKMAFIGSNKGSVNSAVWIANVDGSGLRQITDTLGIRTEAIFSISEDTIFFCQANDYKNYSPIVRKAAHDFDIYTVSLVDNSVKKMTNFGAYTLSNISNLSDNELLLRKINDKEGIFILPLSMEDSVVQIIPKNKEDRELISYSKPIALTSNLLACTSYYELLIIDLNENSEKVILRSPIGQFRTLCFNKRNNKIYFTSNRNSVYSVNIDGSELSEIVLNIDIG